MAKALYLICVPFLMFAIAVALAAAAALIMPAGVMQQAVVVVPVFFVVTSSALAHLLRVFVVPVDQQGPHFTRTAFWGTLGGMVLITALLIVIAYFAVVSLIEAGIIWVVLAVVGQYGLIRYLLSTPTNYEVFD